MKKTDLIYFSAVVLLLAAGAAQAGKTGAGPAASAGPGVGSVVTPGSHELLNTRARDERGRRVLPGNSGSVVLSGDQLVQAIDRLRAFDGAKVNGSQIRAPSVMADGTPASISLDTQTGVLTVTRQEN